MRSALLTSISHDLKTPLAGILGAASTLRGLAGALDEHAKTELIATIIDEAERLNRFIANLLDMTRLESGAIVLYVGERSETLLPKDPQARARATQWLIAALNSVEPFVMDVARIDIFYKDQEWAKLRRPGAVEFAKRRLGALSNTLGDKPFLDGDRFTAGDLMMTTVLRILKHTDIVTGDKRLAAYIERCTARPAFKRAFDSQIADFKLAA